MMNRPIVENQIAVMRVVMVLIGNDYPALSDLLNECIAESERRLAALVGTDVRNAAADPV